MCSYLHYFSHMRIYNDYIYFFSHCLLSHIIIVKKKKKNSSSSSSYIPLYFLSLKYCCFLFPFLQLFTISSRKCAHIYTTFRICLYIKLYVLFFSLATFLHNYRRNKDSSTSSSSSYIPLCFVFFKYRCLLLFFFTVIRHFSQKVCTYLYYFSHMHYITVICTFFINYFPI